MLISTDHFKSIETAQHKFLRIIAPQMNLPDYLRTDNYEDIASTLNISILRSLWKSQDLFSALQWQTWLLSSARWTKSTFYISYYSASYTRKNLLTRIQNLENELKVDIS